ncbi:MAG: VWA domain-containing protein [Anaeroplasmataceae bacterium]|nr:VWA domain-containing protein [Anaeroplasmataceae bacterium]
MSFLYPLGFLGLLGIPILILIYILKNKYTEQVISSTYIWNLSEKFLKNRKPISKLSGIISLILQILVVIAISIGIAHPRFILANQARDYCFILDGSASMNTVQSGTTRLELGKEKIKDIIKNSVDGSKYTLIHLGDSARVIYQYVEDKDFAVSMLDSISKTDMSSSLVDCLSYAQSYYNENRALQTYLVTDRNYNTENVELIDVREASINYAIESASYEHIASTLKVEGSIISYDEAKTLDIDLVIDGKVKETKQVDLSANTSKEISYILNMDSFSSIELRINNEDDLSTDNYYVLYNALQNNLTRTLLISDAPTYLYSAIKIWKKSTIDVFACDEYKADLMKDYDLYIFDSYVPDSLPQYGTVWILNAPKNISDSGFTYQSYVELNSAGALTLPKSSNSQFKKLTKDIAADNMYIESYHKYGQYRNFTNILTYNETPVVFAGTNNFGNREVVFSFDIHRSNLGMIPDFIYLIGNLLDYSFPTILDQTNFTCGDYVMVNVLSNCKSILVESPSQTKTYLDTSNITADYRLTEAGTYSLTMMLGNDEKVIKIFSSLPSSESHFIDASEEMIKLDGNRSTDYADGVYDNLMIIFIVLAVLYLADWMVYCYEQHQL